MTSHSNIWYSGTRHISPTRFWLDTQKYMQCVAKMWATTNTYSTMACSKCPSIFLSTRHNFENENEFKVTPSGKLNSQNILLWLRNCFVKLHIVCHRKCSVMIKFLKWIGVLSWGKGRWDAGNRHWNKAACPKLTNLDVVIATLTNVNRRLE